jgi:pyrimidine-nucleoside phosphorylase
MRVVDLIVRKRDGASLTDAEIDAFVAGVTDGSIPDYQVSALLMAIVIRGMTTDEMFRLTDAMVRSGRRADLDDVPGIKVDKHSTGGVGDKASLVIAPLAAACGVRVPMMSGRGLGHTGGTLDKLESIPGFRVALTIDELRGALRRVGCGMIGQTAEVAPADRRLYALRDVTGTVESEPLIASSIMSKKLAEGVDGLVLDVKTGRGAFMKSETTARSLARALVAIGEAAGVRTEALITDMDTPLGLLVGNSLEVVEAVETLKGRGPEDVTELSVCLAARMLRLAGIETSLAGAEARVRDAVATGAGLEKLRGIIANQGGDPAVLDDYGRLPAAPGRHLVRAGRSGWLAGVDAECVGRAAVALGGGRDRHDQAIDHGVGVRLLAKPGAEVRAEDALVELHYRDGDRLGPAVALVEAAITIADDRPRLRPLVLGDVQPPERGRPS